MPVITVFSGSYCHAEEVIRKVASDLGYAQADDRMLIAEASKRFQIEENKLTRALTGKASIFNKFTHEKERALACLKLVLAEFLREENLVLSGFLSQMVPRDISHILKVCLIADIKYRTQEAEKEGVPAKEAVKKIHKEDESRVLWVEYLSRNKDPWSAELYDIVIPMDKHTASSAASLILENAGRDVLRVTLASQLAIDDFKLAAEVNLRLAESGHDVAVASSGGQVTITIDKHVLMLSSLEEELKRIASAVPSVRSVATKVGPGYYQSDVYRKFDFDVPLPKRVLLVDDEREFVQTLSERLQMRDVGSAVVYGGREALEVVQEEEPEVMVLDLKMPGIDGIEVLRRVRSEHPNVEVIVLTGHGSEEIRDLCMEIGACAYLEKPVDIDTLTRTMQEAYRKMRKKKEPDLQKVKQT
ncbi:MAG: response regulator [Syntrophobacteraceae bacterium]